MAGPTFSLISPPPNGVVWQGAFVPDATSPFTAADPITKESLDDFQSLSGSPLDIVLKFISFRDIETGFNFPAYEANLVDQRQGKLFIKLEPWSWNGKSDNSYPLQDIIAGKYDHLLTRFAKGAAAFGKPIFLSFGHEMNIDDQNRYPWGGDPALYQKAYQHVHAVVSKEAKNITWVWNPNVDFSASQYYPGADYVDWVAIDGYYKPNIHHSMEDVFDGNGKSDDSLAYLKTLNKPTMIGEFACNNAKPECGADLVNFVARDGNIKAFIYFNQDKEDAYAIKPGSEKSEKYRQAVKAIRFREAFSRALLQIKEMAQSIIIAPAPAPAPKTQTGSQPAPLTTVRRIMPAEIDTEIGVITGFEMGKLSQAKLTTPRKPEEMQARHLTEDSPTLEQMEDVLQAIADNQPHQFEERAFLFTRTQLHEKYPDLKAIAASDRKHDYKFSLYFTEMRQYWNNAITLLSAYVQKSLEANALERLTQAYAWAKRIRAHIDNLKQEDAGWREKLHAILEDRASPAEKEAFKFREVSITTGLREIPSDYNLAVLDITEAELHTQIKATDPAFYQEGLELARRGINALFALKDKIDHPADPEYFTVAKAYLIIGDLSQLLANLTRDDNLCQDASAIYSDLSTLEEGEKGFTLNFRNQPITPAEIDRAMAANQNRGYLSETEKEKTRTRIYYYLKGAAILKDVSLNLSFPGPKSIQQSLALLNRIVQGEIKIGDAAQKLGMKPEQIAYYRELANLLQGEILLNLARETGELKTSLKIFGAVLYGAEAELEKTAREVLAKIPPQFEDLHARARLHQIDLDIRQLEVGIEKGNNTFTDVETMLSSLLKEKDHFKNYGSYWDRVIAVLGLLSQAAAKSSQLAEFSAALGQANKIEAEIKSILSSCANSNAITREGLLPSNYAQARLELTLAELLSRSKSADVKYYEDAVAHANRGLQILFSLQDKKELCGHVRLSSTDYFAVAKGIAALADLNDEIGALLQPDTKKAEAHYKTAHGFRQMLINLDQGTALLLGGKRIEITPSIIADALEKGLQAGTITLENKAKAEINLYHRLKGEALLKDAAQFISWPKPKSLSEILFHLRQVEEGLREIEFAAQALGDEPEKNRFFREQAKMITGDLLLAAADQINFYYPKGINLDAPSLEIAGILPIDFADSWAALYSYAYPGTNPETFAQAVIPKEELMESLISAAKDRFDTVYHQEEMEQETSRFQYLYVWARIRRLNLAMRNADYIVNVDKYGQIQSPDAVVKTRTISNTVPLLDEISSIQGEITKIPSNGMVSFHQLELDFLTATLMLNGVPKQEAGRFVPLNSQGGKFQVYFNPPQVYYLLKNNVLENSASLPEISQEYFRRVVDPKIAGVYLQEAQAALDKNKSTTDKVEIAKNKTEAISQARKALSIFIAIEKQIGYLLPSHIYFEAGTLPSLLQKDPGSNEAKRIIYALDEIIKAKELKDISPLVIELKTNPTPGNAEKLLSALIAIEEKTKFELMAEKLALDIHDYRSNLYQEMAVAYSIIKNNIPGGDKEAGAARYFADEYALSAYLEADQSSLTYNLKLRGIYIWKQTGVSSDVYRNFKQRNKIKW